MGIALKTRVLSRLYHIVRHWSATPSLKSWSQMQYRTVGRLILRGTAGWARRSSKTSTVPSLLLFSNFSSHWQKSHCIFSRSMRCVQSRRYSSQKPATNTLDTCDSICPNFYFSCCRNCSLFPNLFFLLWSSLPLVDHVRCECTRIYVAVYVYFVLANWKSYNDQNSEQCSRLKLTHVFVCLNWSVMYNMTITKYKEISRSIRYAMTPLLNWIIRMLIAFYSVCC